MPLSPQRRHAISLAAHRLRRAHLRVEEPRRNDVHAREGTPLPRERFAEVRDGGFGGVVNLWGERWWLGSGAWGEGLEGGRTG